MADYHLFIASKQNLGCYKYKDDREGGGTVVAQWLLTHDTAYCHDGINSDMITALIVAGTVWKCSGMAAQISVSVVRV